jgi:hypothetical protein
VDCKAPMDFGWRKLGEESLSLSCHVYHSNSFSDESSYRYYFG